MQEDQDLLQLLTLLIVEDDPDFWRLIERPMKRRFREVYYAANGVEGLAIIRAKAPDIILTDLQMPEMDGLAMLQVIREEGLAKGPVIVMTAYNDSDHFTPLADAFAYKPVNLAQLLVQIVDLVRRAVQ